jgi:small subunit ribosomal protein S20
MLTTCTVKVLKGTGLCRAVPWVIIVKESQRMANHASALKAHRQSLKHRSINRSNRSNLRTFLKQFNDQLESGKTEDARNSLPDLYAEIDKSEHKKAISGNAAARQKSRLTKRLNAALAGTAKN